MTRSSPLPALWLLLCAVAGVGAVLLAPSGPPKIADLVPPPDGAPPAAIVLAAMTPGR